MAEEGSPPASAVVGVGIVFDDAAKGLVIESLVPGSGAACGDVLPGDELLTIDGKDVTGKKAAAIAKLVAGPVNSTVVMTLRRRVGSACTALSNEDAGEKAGSKGEEAESEVRVVEIERKHFDIDQEHFVPWTEVVDVAKAPLGHGWLHGAGRLWAGVAPMQGTVMQQMKNLQSSVQNNPLFENISSRATMVRQSATSAVLPVLKNMQPSSSAVSDPRPKDYCMHMYTHPDKYVIMPPALPPPGPGEPARRALVIERATVEAQFLPVEQAEEMTRGKAKVEIMGVLGIARLQHCREKY